MREDKPNKSKVPMSFHVIMTTDEPLKAIDELLRFGDWKEVDRKQTHTELKIWYQEVK